MNQDMTNTLTLTYAGNEDPSKFPVWHADRDDPSPRRVLRFPHAPVLTDCWMPRTTLDGTVVLIRSAECGSGCRCAGEFVFPSDLQEVGM